MTTTNDDRANPTELDQQNTTIKGMMADKMDKPGMMPGVMMPGAMPGMMPGTMPGTIPGMMPGMMPGTMPGAVPGMMPEMMLGYGYGPQMFAYCEDPMKELAQSTGAIIRQEIELAEVYSGCETQNRYQVFIQSPMGLKYAFKCNERSGCCSRCCCSNSCRKLEILIRHIASAAEFDTDISRIFLRANKPCACGFLCACRPRMDITLEESKKYLGSVREPFTCCDEDAEVYDENHNLRYRLVGNCCQIGLCCGSSAKKMAEIEFIIKRNGDQVGMMKKMSSSLGEYFTKADSYKISFPLDATPEEKLLLICAGLLIDYQYFENDSIPDKNKRQGM